MQPVSVYLWLLFEWVLQTTVQASVLVCLILLVQVLLRGKAPGHLLYALWLLLLIRLVTPWAPQSDFSLFNLLQTVLGSDLTGTGSSGSVAASIDSGQRISGIDLLTILPVIWLAGAMALGCYTFFVNFAFWARVRYEPAFGDPRVCGLLQDCKARMHIRRTVRVIETDKVSSPSLLGFIRARVLLPKGMTEEVSCEQLRHIFLHELAHLKHHDIVVGYVVSFLQILHWFNPFLWFAFYRMRADRELACDELVLSTKDVGQPESYGRTIIGLVERFNQKRYLPAIVGIMESKSQLKRRIAMIARFRKLSRGWSLLAVLIIVLVATIALTNAKISSEGTGGSTDRPAPTTRSVYRAEDDRDSQPRGYGGYAMGYGGYSADGNRPMTRGKITRPRSDGASSPEAEGMMGSMGDREGSEQAFYVAGAAPAEGQAEKEEQDSPDDGKADAGAAAGRGWVARGPYRFKVKETEESDDPGGSSRSTTP